MQAQSMQAVADIPESLALVEMGDKSRLSGDSESPASSSITQHSICILGSANGLLQHSVVEQHYKVGPLRYVHTFASAHKVRQTI